MSTKEKKKSATNAEAGAKQPEQDKDFFPRSKRLPPQSPLYWVEQKDRYLRQLLIRDIEEITGRRLCVYYANRAENAQIDSRDAAYMAELLVFHT
jgi:hypothetical protein